MDPVWDIAKEQQAIKRSHRIGQKQRVFVEKIIIRGSVEEKIMELNDDLSLRKHSGTKQDDDKIQHRKMLSLLNSLNEIDFNKEVAREELKWLRQANINNLLNTNNTTESTSNNNNNTTNPNNNNHDNVRSESNNNNANNNTNSNLTNNNNNNNTAPTPVQTVFGSIRQVSTNDITNAPTSGKGTNKVRFVE